MFIVIFCRYSEQQFFTVEICGSAVGIDNGYFTLSAGQYFTEATLLCLLAACTELTCYMSRTIPQAVSHLLPKRRPWFEHGPGHVGFVVDKSPLGQAFSKYFGFLANQSTDCSTLVIIHHHPRLVQYTSSGLSNNRLASTVPLKRRRN
jgi:hypothetical protein